MSRTPTPLIVIARWTIAEASLAEVLALLPDLQRESLQEPGCLGYEILQSAKAPNTLVLIERYRDEQAVQAHRESPHYRAIVAGRIVPLLVERQVDVFSTPRHAPRRSRRPPHHQAEIQRLLQRHVHALDDGEQQVDGAHTDLAHGLADRRQRWREVARRRQVIEADHGQVFRHANTQIAAGGQHAQRHLVAEAERRGRRGCVAQ